MTVATKAPAARRAGLVIACRGATLIYRCIGALCFFVRLCTENIENEGL